MRTREERLAYAREYMRQQRQEEKEAIETYAVNTPAEIRGYSLEYKPPPYKRHVFKAEKPKREFSGKVHRMSFFSGDPTLCLRPKELHK